MNFMCNLLTTSPAFGVPLPVLPVIPEVVLLSFDPQQYEFMARLGAAVNETMECFRRAACDFAKAHPELRNW